VSNKGNRFHFSDGEIDRLAEDLNRDGICVLRGVFERSLIEEWARAFDSLFKERQNRPGGLAPREQARFYLTLPWVKPFADESVYANRAVLGVINRVLAQEYVLVQLGVDTPVLGSDYQETHRDFRPLFTEEIVTPLYALAVNIPLVDVSEENGPFQMARGTHLLEREEGLRKIETGEIPLESFHLEMGDAVIRSPLALHRGSPNRTDTPRPMVVMGYAMHWLHTPKVDVTVQRDYYESLPAETQKLLRCNVVERLEQKAETYVDFKY
jgi:ectoine hydroxylase-related dioxygenase (phytanoyl-CoA dioxygenase family)